MNYADNKKETLAKSDRSFSYPATVILTICLLISITTEQFVWISLGLFPGLLFALVFRHRFLRNQNIHGTHADATALITAHPARHYAIYYSPTTTPQAIGDVRKTFGTRWDRAIWVNVDTDDNARDYLGETTKLPAIRLQSQLMPAHTPEEILAAKRRYQANRQATADQPT